MSDLTVQYANVNFREDNVPRSYQFDDVYFCKENGLDESIYVFQQGNQLWQRWQNHTRGHFTIVETGFGTGLNFFATLALFTQFKAQYPQAKLKRLFFISFEKYPLPAPHFLQAYQTYPQFMQEVTLFLQQWRDPIKGCQRFHFDQVYLDLWCGDLADNLPQLGDYMLGKVDAWYLDGFAPSKNPEMWQPSLYQYMYRFSAEKGTFATFTAASAVRKGLQQAGFEVVKRKGYGKKRECLSGQKKQENTPALDEQKYQFPWYLGHSVAETFLYDSALDVAIIGGGIASACLAYSLMQRGANVTLYCADPALAMNASGNKQGAFYPQLSDDDMRYTRFYIHAFYYGQQFLQKLSQPSKLNYHSLPAVPFEYDWGGVALCGYNQAAAKKLTQITQQNYPTSLFKFCSVEQLSEHCGVPIPYSGGFIEQGGWLSPKQLVNNLLSALEKCGLKIRYSSNITKLTLQEEQEWLLTTDNQQSFQHRCVVLANGHQLNQFEQTEKLSIYPVRGQVSEVQTNDSLKQIKSVICYDGYLTPVSSEQTHCLGASHIRNDNSIQFSLDEQQQNQQKIQQNLAGVAWVKEIDTHHQYAKVGVRCGCRDRIPLMGNVANYTQQRADYKNLFNLRRRRQPIPVAANYPNLYLCGALGSRGLTSAPLLAETLVSLIYNEPLPLAQDILHALSPNRTWLRKLLKGTTITD